MDEIKTLIDQLQNHTHRSTSGESRVTNIIPLSELREKLSLLNGSQSTQEKIATYLEHTTRLQSPNYIGHQVSVPSVGATMADLIHGATNNSTAVYDMGAAGVAVEMEMIAWMLQKFGWSEDKSGGVFTHGGSMANLTAMLAARAHKQPDVWEKGNDPDLIALAPDVSHYCVNRTLSIMGLGAQNLWLLPTCENGQVILEGLEASIKKAQSLGKKIFAISVNGASTSTGYYDDLQKISEVARRHQIWLHVDGAHGASAIISRKYKHLIESAGLADSIVWDAHKMLMSSSLCAAVLFKDKENLAKTFQQNASYLKKDNSPDFPSLYPYTLECTKPPIATKLYLTLLHEGEAGLAENIDQLYSRTFEFWQAIEKEVDFSAPFAPQSNILLFKYKSGDELQRKIHERVLKHGEYHITFAHWKNTSYLRLTVMNQKTTEQHLRALLDHIRELSLELAD